MLFATFLTVLGLVLAAILVDLINRRELARYPRRRARRGLAVRTGRRSSFHP